MDQYNTINDMTTEKILDYITKIESQLNYYKMTENAGMIQQLKALMETCYFVLDERNFVEYTETYWPANGIVIDTSNSLEANMKTDKNNDSSKPRRKRYN